MVFIDLEVPVLNGVHFFSGFCDTEAQQDEEHVKDKIILLVE